MKRCTIGGQAVLEGVMMKAPDAVAIAVRKPSGEIVTQYTKYDPPSKKHRWMGWPIIRGVVNFVDMIKLGVNTISYSAKVLEIDEEKPSKVDQYVAKKTGKAAEDVMMSFAVVLSLALSIGLFFVLPTLIAKPLTALVKSTVLRNLIEGLIRLAIFIIYVASISLMKDIRRVYMYHGAEHKTIACYENEEELTIENARKYTRLHPRCGTNYMLLVMAISILIFTLFGWNSNIFIRILIRLAMLPVVAGVAYEVLKLAAKSDNIFARIVRWPGVMLQKLTTREPDDGMLEVAITAFNLAINEGRLPENDHQADNEAELQTQA
ncbi:hypothetical protein SDC9_122710 [bioreactor metagenome]|uniref:DUF1385 domain-containing protein n=1 Tax=bioreactor metagenome TaxID=1076179 RepID=A0A645CFG2_9ZZZZ